MSEQGLTAWKLPLIVAAIAVSIVAGFYLGGPGLGMAVGGLAAATIVVMAVRNPPRGPIVPVEAPDSRRRLLVVLDRPLEDGEAVESVARSVAGDGHSRAAEVLLIAPCRNRPLHRWASDLGPGRHRAQRNLVLSAASLAKAGVGAQGRVGDEDLVQMVEDELGSFAATEVILVGAGSGCEELESRLRAPFRHILVDPPTDSPAGDELATERSLFA